MTESLGIPVEVISHLNSVVANSLILRQFGVDRRITVRRDVQTVFAALRLAKRKGNSRYRDRLVVGSAGSRKSDHVLYTYAREISVATTKAYSAQLAAMYLLAVQMAKSKRQNR